MWGPVLIAALFLAVIGGSAGWVLGQQHTKEAAQGLDTGGPGLDTAGDDVTVGDQGRDGDDGQGEGAPGGDGGQQPWTPPADDVSPKRCPTHTVDLARKVGATGDLARVLYVRTTIGGVGTQVWICRDGAGQLFYQGHQFGRGAEFNESYNSLFLPTVEVRGDWYVAVNETSSGRTVYQVSRDGLRQGKAGDASDPLYPAEAVSP